MVKEQLLNPRRVLALAAQMGLDASRERYNHLVAALPPDDATVFELEAMKKIRELHTEARVLELAYGALAAALVPKTAQELTDQALKSIVSEALGIPSSSEGITLAALFAIQKLMANTAQAVPALKSFAEGFGLATNLAKANDAVIEAWAERSASSCSW